MTTIWENFRDKVDTLVAEYIKELEEKNQTLKDKIEFLTNCLDDRDKSIELMKERIRFLEQCLDNKEKVNKSLREELQRYKDMWDSWEF